MNTFFPDNSLIIEKNDNTMSLNDIDKTCLNFINDNTCIVNFPNGLVNLKNDTSNGKSKFINSCYYDNYNLLLNFPNTLNQIDNDVFTINIKIIDIKFPDSITRIKSDNFINCSYMTNLILPPLLKQIDSGCFTYINNIKSLIIPNGITKIDNFSFQYCPNLIDLSLPDSLIQIGWNCFMDASIYDLSFPINMDKIGYNCFNHLKRATLTYDFLLHSYDKFKSVNVFIIKNAINYIQQIYYLFPNSNITTNGMNVIITII